MKRIFLIITLFIFAVSYLIPSDITGGVSLGFGTVSDSDLSDVYGGGFVFNPYLCYGISDQFAIGIGYETGYKKDGKVGIFDDPATLEISGFQLFGEYRFKSKKMSPYLKLGYGYYTVKNSFETEVLKKYEFSKKGSGVILGGGIRYPLNDKFSITGELDYILLKVEPFDQSINSGGLRFLLGLAAKFDI